MASIVNLKLSKFGKKERPLKKENNAVIEALKPGPESEKLKKRDPSGQLSAKIEPLPQAKANMGASPVKTPTANISGSSLMMPTAISNSDRLNKSIKAKGVQQVPTANESGVEDDDVKALTGKVKDKTRLLKEKTRYLKRLQEAYE